MQFREEALDSVVEEIAAILATGYLRLLRTRTLGEPSRPTEKRVDVPSSPSPHGSHRVTSRERGE